MYDVIKRYLQRTYKNDIIYVTNSKGVTRMKVSKTYRIDTEVLKKIQHLQEHLGEKTFTNYSATQIIEIAVAFMHDKAIKK